MDSKRIGNIGEAKVLCKFVELGFPVYVSFGDDEKADLIAEFNGKLNKIQVKTAEDIKEEGKIIFDLTSSTVHRSHGTKHIYTNQEIDYFACYSKALDEIYLIAVDDAPNTALTLRYLPPKNNQKQGIRMATDYQIDTVLSKLS